MFLSVAQRAHGYNLLYIPTYLFCHGRHDHNLFDNTPRSNIPSLRLYRTSHPLIIGGNYIHTNILLSDIG